MVNSNTRENREELVSKRHFCSYKDLSINSKELLRSLRLRSISCLRSKTMNLGKSKTPHWLKSFTRLEIITKKPNIWCYHKELNRCKSCLTRVNISSSNYLMRLEELSCLIILQVEKTSLKLESSMLIIRARTLRNGLSLSDIIVISIMLEKKKTNNTEKSNMLEKN